MMTKSSVGVVGVGALGLPVAKRLASAGFSVRCFDIDRDAMSRVGEAGLVGCGDPAEAADGSDYVITCVTDPPAVEQCTRGSRGVVEGLKPGALLIEMTTSTPATTRSLEEPVKSRGADLVDAPVSRGVPAAEEGTLSIMAGGDRAAFKAAQPILSVLGTDLYHVGALGSGHAVKALNMLLMAVNLVATSEAIAVGKQYGLTLDKMLEVLNVSSGGSYVTENHLRKFVLAGTFSSRFTLGLMHKDVGIALQMARELGLPTVMGDRAETVYEIALQHLGGSCDNMLIVPFLERLMNGLGLQPEDQFGPHSSDGRGEISAQDGRR